MHKAYKPDEAPEHCHFEEMCPECGEFIPVVIDDACFDKYMVACPMCGHPMMLCTLCHWDSDGDCNCDWNPEYGCFRNNKKEE